MENSDTFGRFVQDYFSAEFRWNPAWATGAGIHAHDTELADRTPEAHGTRVGELHALAARAATLGRSELSDSDRIDLELISGRLVADLLRTASLETWRHNPIDYLWYAGRALDSLVKRRFASVDRRLEALISRLRVFPRILKAMRENVENPAPEFTDVALRLARGSSTFMKSIQTWALDAAGGDAALTARFNSVYQPAENALGSATSWLEALSSSSTGRFPIGPDALRALLVHEEMTDTPLDDLLDIATANLERDYRAFVAVAGEIDPRRTPADVMHRLSKDHPDETQLLGSAQSTLDRVREFLDSHLLVSMPTIPPPTIAETPPYYRFGAFAAMDSPGAYEAVARDAFYYVTPPEQDWDTAHKEEHLRLFNRPVVDLITIHETYPGHFLQFANATRFPTHTRRLISCGSNVEGWAHYVEQMMIEEGYGSGDADLRLAQLQEALVRDCRFVAAIRLHTGTMSIEQAADLFRARAFMEAANALEEARRGTFDPTYLVYTLGKLQIYKLRDDWEARNGKRDLRKFHDAVLREGGVPLRLIRRRLLGRAEGDLLYPPEFYREAIHR